MADKRSQTSAENGKKGGRPKGSSMIKAIEAREYIAEQLRKELEPIVEKAIQQAKQGDRHAREWLSERGWGKVTQTVNTEDDEGNKQPILANAIFSDNSNKESRSDDEKDSSGAGGNVRE